MPDRKRVRMRDGLSGHTRRSSRKVLTMQTDVRTLLRLIWGALLTSTVIYVILASVLVQGPDNNLNRGLFSNPVIPALTQSGS